jgi:hypothetical protein
MRFLVIIIVSVMLCLFTVLALTFPAKAQIVSTAYEHPVETLTMQAEYPQTESLVGEHPTEIVGLLLWAVLGLGAMFLGLLTWIVLIQYHAIKTDIHELNVVSQKEFDELWSKTHANEVELANLKTSCRIYHGEDRRKVDLLNLQKTLHPEDDINA